MKKFVLFALLVAVAVGISAPAHAWDPEKQKNLGQDHIKMQWYLLDYGKKEGVPFAIARKYYTNNTVKQQTIDLLMSKYSLSPEAAGATCTPHGARTITSDRLRSPLSTCASV